MDLFFSYLLYFNRVHLWEALQGVAAIAEPHHPPTVFNFPDHNLVIPLNSVSPFEDDYDTHHGDPIFRFITPLIFEEDEAIAVYTRDQGEQFAHRGPPGEDGISLVTIDHIYLKIYHNQAWWKRETNRSDIVLFGFHTIGLQMDLLFYHSLSIRNTFVSLLEQYNGICGVFKMENDGELFWLDGKRMDERIDDPYLPPEEINELLFKNRREIE